MPSTPGLGSIRTVGIVTVINNLIGNEDAQRERTFALLVSQEEVSSTAFVRQHLFLSGRPKAAHLLGIQLHTRSAQKQGRQWTIPALPRIPKHSLRLKITLEICTQRPENTEKHMLSRT